MEGKPRWVKSLWRVGVWGIVLEKLATAIYVYQMYL
jgi:hypothetical protein